MRQVLVIGLGSFGSALVEELVKKQVEVIVIEQDKDRAQQFRDTVDQVIVADATNREVLETYAQDVDCAVVCPGERVDSSVLITYHLKEIGVKRLIAKVSSAEHGQILKLIGVDDVVFPERDEAQRLATNLVAPDVLDFIKLSNEFSIVEIAVPEEFVNQSIGALNMRRNFGLEILAVKNPLSGAVRVMPSVDYAFQPDDVLVVLGDVGALQRLRR